MQSLLGDSLVGVDGSSINVSDVAGPGKYVGIYFSAHWCPPCRAFTPAVSKWYTAFREKRPDFTLVFVSSDRDQKSFDEYRAEMSFPALPFENREGKAKLAQLCKVQGIPTLAILDGATGEVITTRGREKVMADPAGAGFPWRPKPMADVLVGDLLGKGGAKTTLAEAVKGKVFALYFSAHWCMPCRMVTPRLAEVYAALKEQGKPFEVVFVSFDRTEKDFDSYFAEMPWLAVPYDSPLKDEIEGVFDIEGIPTAILIDATGPEGYKVITEDGVEALMEGGAGAYPWKEAEVKDE